MQLFVENANLHIACALRNGLCRKVICVCELVRYVYALKPEILLI
jgi:hypothetical protein